jgi:hypothetical protein
MTHGGDGPSPQPRQTGGFVDERVILAWHTGTHPGDSAVWARNNTQYSLYTVAWDNGAGPVLPWDATGPL